MLRGLLEEKLKKITTQFNLANRVETMTSTDTFITLKDHKENFQNKPKCRLINPAKSNLGTISKQILEGITKIVRQRTQVNQRCSTADVISWFQDLDNKSSMSFIVFHIADFYPSISESLLSEAIKYSSQFTEITQEQVDIIMHCRKSLLYSNGKAWVKQHSKMFNVTMGTYDSAEICELV